MPAAAKTSTDEILAVASVMLEQQGIESVSMHAIARAVGVRAPSLYKHFPDRTALLEQLALGAFTALADRMVVASRTTDPLRAMASAYRAFAHEAPHHYQFMMSAQASALASVDGARALAAAPVLRYLTPLVGADRALTCARAMTAYLHGFVSMELNGAFRLGGDPAADFEEGFELLATAVSGFASQRRHTP